jgi:hypothetical protein
MRYLRDGRGPVIGLTLLLVLGVTAVALLVRWQGSVPTTANNFERYMPEPGEAENETQELHGMEDYWHTRVTYPTGRYDGHWLLDAARQDKLVQERVPAGRVVYNQGNGASPLSLDPNSWTSLGPKPLESNGCISCFSYGHVSGRVNDIVIDPVDSTVAYIASVGGGVWKSTNCCTATTTWNPMLDDPLISTTSIDDLSIDPSNHNTIYAGTGDLNFGSFSMGSAGVLKSTDAGVTWSIKGAEVFTGYYPEPAGQYPQYQAIGKIEADPNNSNTLIAGTKTGVYFSYNGGDTWSGPCLTNSFSTQRQDTTGLVLSDAGSTTDMYVAVGSRGISTTVQSNLAENGANGIYKTTVPASGCPASWTLTTRADNGWPVGTGSGIPQYQANGNKVGRIDIDIAPSNPNYVYAIVQEIGGTYQYGVKGVWRTTDAGATWEQRAGLGSNATDWAGCARTGQQNWYNQHIEIDPLNPEHVWVSTIDIFKSSNGADTFTNITCGYNGGTTVHVDHHAIEFVPGSSDVVLAGSDGGAYVSTNATSGTPAFSRLNDSLSTIEFYSGDITANFATDTSPGANGGAQDNGSMVNVWNAPTPVGPALWQLRKGGDGMYARIEPVQEMRWYQESQNGSLAVTTNGPYSSQVSATGGWTADRLSFVFPYEIYKYDCPPTGCTHLIAGSYRVWETLTGGIPTGSWMAISPDLTKNTLADRSFINQLSYSVSLSTTAIVGTNDGNVQYGFGLGLGVAATWVNVTGGNSVLPNRPILDVTTDPVTPTIGYAAVGGFDQNTPGTPGHVYMVTCTANCGSFTWENKSGNLPNIPVDSILANPRYPRQVFAGTDWGLYYTNDITVASPTWFRFQTGMPNVMIWDMSIDRGFTTLSVWTRGRGAYVWPLPEGPVGGGTPTPTVTGTVPTVTATGVVATATATGVAGTSTSTPIVPVSTATRTSTAGISPTTASTVVASGTAVSTATSSVVVPSSTSTVAVATQTPGGASATPQPPTATTAPSATATACTITFTDVDETNVFYPFIRCLACRGIISGYEDGTFRPFNDITRGQIAKIVSNAAGFDEDPGPQIYEDVDGTNPFYQWINRLSMRGHMGGYPCGTVDAEPCIKPDNRPYFRPFNNATRGQLSKIVSNAAGINTTPSGLFYTDVQEDHPFYTWIMRLTEAGVMSGYDCGGPGEPCDEENRPYFRPYNNVTRGQASKIVANTFYPGCETPVRK